MLKLIYILVLENIGLTLRARLKSQVILKEDDESIVKEEHLVRITKVFVGYERFHLWDPTFFKSESSEVQFI